MIKLYKHLLCSVLIVFTFSCKKSDIDRPEKPSNLISEDKMVDVLYDMALISAAKGINKKMLENKGVKPRAFVFNKHKIDSVQFEESNNFYAYDIRTYQDIYAKVKERLEADKKRFDLIAKQEKKKRDSINKAKRKRDSIEKRAIKERKRTNEKLGLLKKDEKSLESKQ